MNDYPYQAPVYAPPPRTGNGTIIGIVIIALVAVASMIALLVLGVRPIVRHASYYRYNSIGNAYMGKGQYQAAIDEYSVMVDVRPSKFDGYSLRGMAEYRARLYTQAIADETKAIALLGTKAGIEEIGFGTESHAKKLAYLPETLGSLYFNRGLDYYAKGDLKSAARDYSSTISYEPKDWQAHWNRAETYRTLHKFPQALADANFVVNHYPNRSSVYKLRADSERDAGDIASALADYTKAISIKNDYFDAYYARGEVYEQKRDFAKNMANWQQAVIAVPDNAFAWADLGWAKYLAGDIDGSMAASLSAIEIDKSNVTAKSNLALCYAVKGDWARAQPLYREVLSHGNATDRAGALGDIQNALKSHPNSTPLRNAATLLGAAA